MDNDLKSLTKNEAAALAMHEIMKREQRTYEKRIRAQQQISQMSDEKLKEMVELL